MMHPLIISELARAKAADIDRRSRAAQLERPLTASQGRRRPARRTARRLVLGLARPVRNAP
jgi:hypothetical protein